MFQEIFAPNGELSKMDTVMQLTRWQKVFSAQFPAAMGKPTFPLLEVVYQASFEYLNGLKASNGAVDYGLPEGETENREIAADALRFWYETVPIAADDVIFTVGGASALDLSWEILKKRDPTGKVLLQEPWYPLHAPNQSDLYPVNVMQEPGYRLTAALLERCITKAEKEGVHFRAVLLCDPNNPMGTCIGREELMQIAVLLDERLPDVPVILDQAYCEMSLYSKHVSLAQVASPALLKRMVILHSATKALSMAGLRAALVLIFDPSLREEFLALLVSRYGHVSKMIQYIYARALDKFCKNLGLQHELVRYYREKVEYVSQRAEQMSIALPDPDYKIDGTFYVPVILDGLIGQPMPAEAAAVFGQDVKYVLNSEHITYKLLIESGIAFAPFAYYLSRLKKGEQDRGFMRITCSADMETLKDMMDRLEQYLLNLRRTTVMVGSPYPI